MAELGCGLVDGEVSAGKFSIQPSAEWEFDVSDPKKVGSRTFYTVKSQHGDKANEVERRYSDFKWLHDALALEFAGSIGEL
jgi:hypothetical protein